MILGIGIDVVDITRIAQMRHRHGVRFERKIFTPHEIAYCRRHVKADQHFAARFAAKEAAMKALGTGMAKKIGFLSIEVRHNTAGGPMLHLTKAAATHARKMGMKQVHVSLTHSDEWAAAVVVIEGCPKKSQQC